MNRLQHSGFPKARRRVSMRSALFLLMIAFGVMLLRASLGMLLPGMGAGVSLALSALATVAGFGIPAYIGLCIADGDQRKIVPAHALSRAQVLDLAMLGVLFVCPASLAADMISALMMRLGIVQPAASPALPMGLFLPMLLTSVLLAPACEELFFRGYLVNALKPYSPKGSVWFSALVFAVIHGVDAALPARFALGCLLAVMMIRTGSILAPAIVHAAYNLMVLALAFSGLERLVTGAGLFACLLRLLGCAAFAAVLRHAYAGRKQRRLVEMQQSWSFSRREWALIGGAGAALLAAMIISGVTA